MKAKRPQLEESWMVELGDEFEKPYMQDLKKFLESEYAKEKIIYPKKSEYFLALNKTPFHKVKAVILGQDPYHGPGQAHGLCFSVRPKIKPPPSLVNIFKELKADLGVQPPDHGCLLPWTEKGILLLNSVLTVESSKPASHQKRGWERFTDKIIEVLNLRKEPIAFILWGSYAQKKGSIIDRNKHLVIEAVHPSPLSAHRGFFGSKPFSQVVEFQKRHRIQPIDWQLPQLDELRKEFGPSLEML